MSNPRISDWVAHHARTRPDAPALRMLETAEARTWRELDTRVGALAGALRRSLGPAPGARVAVLSDGDIRVLELQFACIRAGLTFVPLNFRLTLAELTAMGRRLDVAAVFGDATWAETAKALAAGLRLPAPILWGRGEGGYERLAATSPSLAGRDDMPVDAVAQILFTSGSTAAPKAAIGTLGAMVWQALNQAEASRAAEAGAHVFTPLPLFHAGGLNSLTNPVLYFGGCVTLAARFDPEAAARFLGDPANGVTHVALVPLMYALIAEAPSFAAADFSALRLAILAGGRLTPALQAAYAGKGVAFSPQYGGTETGPSVTALPAAMADKAAAGSCGMKVLHVEVRLVDEHGEDVAPGEPGEVWLRGPAIAPGYVDRDRVEDFEGDWFRTGDVARVDADGCYFVVDRKKDMYKSGGENVSPAEVEAVLADHPDVAEVAVIGVAHERWGETGLAVVAPRPGAAPTLDDLRRHCEARLARYKQPHRLELVERLPRNVTGKVAKEELRARYRGGVHA